MGAFAGKSCPSQEYGMSSLGEFRPICGHEVIKNPDTDNDFARFEAPLNKSFAGVLNHE